jgi:hypothetical protein
MNNKELLHFAKFLDIPEENLAKYSFLKKNIFLKNSLIVLIIKTNAMAI